MSSHHSRSLEDRTANSSSSSSTKTHMTSNRVWLVTGASSGLGKAVVEYALSKGDQVSATCRQPTDLDDLQSKFPPSQLIVLRLDVTSPEEVTSAFAKTVEAFGRVDVVYNNAGYAVIGETESVPEDVARRQFDVNFWGAVTVSREAVRVFRETNKPIGGVLLQASSISGVIATEAGAFYSASKFALEGISEALAKELDPSWNIRVRIIEFGPFATRALTKESSTVVPLHPAYSGLPSDRKVLQTRAFFSSSPAVDGDPAKAAREIYNIAEDDKLSVIRVPLAPLALAAMEQKAEEIKKVVAQTAKFSADVEYD